MHIPDFLTFLSVMFAPAFASPVHLHDVRVNGRPGSAPAEVVREAVYAAAAISHSKKSSRTFLSSAGLPSGERSFLRQAIQRVVGQGDR